ncbi:thioredoxin domain-containing protein [Streptomyces sp. ME02-6987-2C]|uniref:DsbA family protein n=1 Tax=unclassified Streptomyces TaxID=2593676 RepID=UPI001B3618C9|nr:MULTISPECIES: thioredoxin domain-containing protein [unclassified Streptomyces]MBQ0952728.1 DsbA family protein [Streptomyces sp. RK76]MDX3365025.1 thioredoxin domain-containing protein [Streptomyces sp. ME02-6987-2C]MDX3420774.1 thioredoxin domain-containing protein [Streptomyces sp. ME02-6985-2c]
MTGSTPSSSASPSSSRPPSASRRSRRRTVAALAVLAAAAVTAAFALTLDDADNREEKAGEPAAVTASAAPAPADEGLLALARRDASDPLAIGRADAPVVLIEYSDFQCPFCGRFARETKPELLRSYVDKGTLRIEWRNFPIFGEESEQAALAGWAAGRQNKFWEFHDVAYGKPRERNTGAFDAENLVAMAREAGIADIERFQADMASDEARGAVRADQEEGYTLGVTSTPAFLVNGRPILGAQPTDTFEEAVETAAKAAKTANTTKGAGR